MAVGCHWCASLTGPNPTSDRRLSHLLCPPLLHLMCSGQHRGLLAPHFLSHPLTGPSAGCTIEMCPEFNYVALSPPLPSWSRLHCLLWIKTASSLTFPSLVIIKHFLQWKGHGQAGGLPQPGESWRSPCQPRPGLLALCAAHVNNI